MDIVKILRRIRYHDIALKSSVVNTNERMYHVRHAVQNIINTEDVVFSSTEEEGVAKRKNPGVDREVTAQ